MSWTDPDTEDTTIYKVVVNHEERTRYGLSIGRTRSAGGTPARW